MFWLAVEMVKKKYKRFDAYYEQSRPIAHHTKTVARRKFGDYRHPSNG
jgi:hypothetical protein